MDVVIVLNNANPSVPFTIKINQNEKLERSNECWRFKAYRICANTIAVAGHLNRLQNVFDWFKKCPHKP